MPSIDQLSIEITANADTATKAIANLTSYLNGLNHALNGINGFTAFVKAVEGLSAASNQISKTSQAVGKLSSSSVSPKFTNGIDTIINSLNRLSEVSTPDFSSLTNAADSLNNASTDKIVSNIKAVKGALDESLPSADSLKNSLRDLGNDSANVVGNMSDMAQNIGGLKEASNNLTNAAESANTLDQSLLPINQRVAEIVARIKELNEEMKNIEGGKLSDISYTDAIQELKELKKELNDIKKVGNIGETIESVGETGAKSVANAKEETITFKEALSKTAEVVEHLGHKLGQIGDLGIKGLKIAYRPLSNLTEEYREKLGKITGFFKSFRANVQKELNKLSAFWKRTMKTFTFMLVRKAITAIIDNVKEAVDELALFEMKLGTLSKGQFNTSLSEIIADFHYIGRAIVAAFEPLINFVVPAINAVASALANVLALVGEFFAAFTGQSYFVRARKTVVNYGEELDKNNSKLKEQKKLLLGIDELNVMPSKNDSSGSSGGGGVNYKDAFDEKPVSEKMKNLAEKIKGILSQLFDPLKDAWDRNGEYVKQAFKYMMTEIGKLCASVGKDFLEVWNGPIMAKVFDHILQSVGDIMTGIGNLAKNFREAWEDGGKGKKLLENLAQIAETLTGWIEKVTKYFKDWTEGIDFNPLIASLVTLSEKLNKVANFLGGVFYDVMTNVVFKYIEWMIEEGLPHLSETIGEVIDAFDFDKIRSDLQILEVAFEHMAEQIDVGITNAIGNVGKALAEWMNSDEFTEFCNSLAYFMDLITAERVEKLFTALGIGLLNTAKGLANFVSSDSFKSFVDKIIEWYDSKSAEEIAGYLEKIAAAIALFKFAEFVAPGVAGFLNFISTISTLTSLGQIAKDLGVLASGTEAVGTAAGAAGASTGGFAASLSAIAAPVAIIIAVLATLTASFGGVKGLIEELSRRIDELRTYFETVLNRAFIPMEGAISTLQASFSNFTASLGSFRGAWVLVLDILQTIVSVIGGTLMGAISGIVTAIGGAITFISGVINVVGGVLSTVAGVVQGFIGIIQLIVGTITGNQAIVENALNTIQKSFEALGQGVTAIGTGICQAFEGAFTFVIGLLSGFVGGVIEFFKGLKYNLLGDPIVIDIVNGVVQWFGEMVTGVIKCVGDLVSGVIKGFTGLLTDAVAKASDIKNQVVGKFDEFKTNAVKKFDDFKTNAQKAVSDAKTDIIKNAGELKKNFVDKVSEIPKEGKKKFDDLKTAASEKFDLVKSKIKDKMDQTVTDVKTKLDKMKTKFEGVKLESIATNIIRGFTSGLKSAWQGVIQWANEAISNLKQKFQEALKIQSPSKVFEEYGKYTVEGFNQGLEKFKDTTDQTVDDWVGEFSDVQVQLTPTLSTSDMAMSNMSNSKFTSNNLGNTAQQNNTSNEIKVILQLDGRTIYENVVQQNNQQIKRTGRSLLAY